jgi:hypothetical protein
VVGVPDGANAGRHRAPEDTEGTENPQNSGAEETEEDPGTPAEQVQLEIAAAQAAGVLPSIFGFGGPHEAGGGGTGGQFMFADLAELDGVITEWETERDGIEADRDAIDVAMGLIAEPAGDMMSAGLTSTSKQSLEAMKNHSGAMLDYANEYLNKLYASRQQMAIMEDGAVAHMRGVRA